MPGKRYTVEDTQTGKRITFEWHGSAPPTDADIEAVFQAAGLRSAASAPAASGGVLDALGDFASGLWSTVNPIEVVRSLGAAVSDPIGTTRAIGQAQGRLGVEAAQAFQEGDYWRAARKGIHYLLPLLGPALDQSSDSLMAGETARGLGEATGIGLGTVGPAGMAKAGMSLRTPAALRPPNARMAEVLAFAEREGIPVDAATATGSRVIRTVQNVTDRGTLGGALVGDRARTAQTQALRATSDRLAERVHPTAVTAEQAGEGVRAALQRRIADLDTEADTAYGQLRAIEADPANTRTVRMRVPMTDSSGVTKLEVVSMDMPLPVDLRSVKRALSPIYERMKRQLPITVQRASPGFKAVENVMQSYDYMPASVVDADLSAIKELARGADLPELRTFSQGLAAGVVKELEDAVQAAVAQAGPEATTARDLGRQATAIKHRVGDLLRELRSEPVQVFEQATWSRDAGVERLQRIAQEAPGELPKIGRAYLDNLFDRARREGGFERPAGLWERWNNLGPRTKMLLFQDRGLVRDLDNFFLLAKKLDENPNPSGTGYAVAQFLGGSYVFHDIATGVALQISGAGLSKLLHSRQGVKLLTQGLRTPVTNERAAAATASQLAALAGRDARPVALPAAAQRDRDEAP